MCCSSTRLRRCHWRTPWRCPTPAGAWCCWETRSSSTSRSRVRTPTVRTSPPSAICSESARPSRRTAACSWSRPGGLHPDICEFTSETFYERRLGARAGLEFQRVVSPGPVSGTGLRFLPVRHGGNRSFSDEEADRVADLVGGLVGGDSRWTDRAGDERTITLEDVLVIAPYNAQVFRIQDRLPGARVGTVDKFQGQEAPVVIYSMATSTPEDAPHGMEFLYSLNRLNVATSRARCVCVLVGSPELFSPECRTPRQMQLANAFCRYRELAAEIAL